MDSVAKFLHALLGSGVRALGTILFGALLILFLRPWGWFAETFADPLWRWPLIIVVFSGAGLSTYPIELCWNKRKEAKKRGQRIARLSSLSHEEQKLLAVFLDSDYRVVCLKYCCESINLAKEGLIIMIDEKGHYQIDDAVWMHLKDNRHLLQ